MAKKEDMHKKSDQELLNLLSETREKLRAERVAAAGSRAKDADAPHKFRKTIARILTEQSARKRASQSATN